jgi:hypothetical protein
MRWQTILTKISSMSPCSSYEGILLKIIRHSNVHFTRTSTINRIDVNIYTEPHTTQTFANPASHGCQHIMHGSLNKYNFFNFPSSGSIHESSTCLTNSWSTQNSRLKAIIAHYRCISISKAFERWRTISLDSTV